MSDKIYTEEVPCGRCKERTEEINSGGRYIVLSCKEKQGELGICQLKYERIKKSRNS